jgi:peptide/nickel transport system ATP-binding protein
MSVAIDNLSIDFTTDQGIVHAVRNASIKTEPGRIIGVVGESGSGKSTLGLALLGLLANNARVTSGALTLGTEQFDLTKSGITAGLRGTRLAMIFQDPLSSLNPVFTIRSHLYEVLRNSPSRTERPNWPAMAEEALASVGIDSPRKRLDQYPYEFSGGMRQRVAIAMALIARPELLIADEPTTALDVTVEAQVMKEILKLREAVGCTILFISHSLGLVAQHCDDICVLYSGEVLEQGKVSKIVDQPGHPYTSALLDCEVTLEQLSAADPSENRFQVVPGDLPDPRDLAPGCIFQDRCKFVFEPCANITPLNYRVGTDAGHLARCHLRAPGR